MHAETESGAVAARLLRVLGALVDEMHPGGGYPVSLHSHLERDLGLDSLARAELLLRLGREFGSTFSDQALSDAETPLDLLREIGRHETALTGKPLDILPEAPETALPTQAKTLIEVLEWHAAKHPQRTHVLLYGADESTDALTYGALHDKALRIAAGLLDRGLLSRQTVALMLPSGEDYLSSFFGIMLAGGIPVPIYPPTRLAQLGEHLQRHAGILNNAEASFLITVPEAKAVAALLQRDVRSLNEILTLGDVDRRHAPLHYRPRAEDIAFLQYTSGSTGDPKGVMLTHANLLANLRAMGQATGVGSQDIFVSWLPLYHDMGLIGAWFGSLYFGVLLVLMSPLSFLARPARWLNTISRHRGTISAAPNFAYELCARKLGDADLADLDLSSWRLALNGAEPVSPATLQAFTKRFAGCGFKPEAMTPVYGLAECSVGLSFPPPGRGPLIDLIDRAAFTSEKRAEPATGGPGEQMQIVSCGRPLAGHEIRIIDETGAELAERRIGRIEFRGASATAGYHRNPEASRRLFNGAWLDTGDRGYSAAGELYVTGRDKDLIIRAGQNIYPYELEQAVGNIPGIRKGCVAVFAGTDPDNATERLVIVAETAIEESGARAALGQRINEIALDIIGMPADTVVLSRPNSILKTSSGKIRRAASRQAYEQGRLAARPVAAWRQKLALGTALLRNGLSMSARRTGHFLFAGLCWLLFALIGLPVAALLAALQSPDSGCHLLHVATRLFLRLSGMPVRAIDNKQLPETTHLLLVNHCSYLDALVLYAALPASRHYAFVAKDDLARQPLIRAILRGLGTVFVARFSTAKSMQEVERISSALNRGQNLVIFPEGTFSREAGLKAFHMGAFVAACRSGVPIQTAGLRGTRLALRDGSWLPRHSALGFALGPLLEAPGNNWRTAIRLRDQARGEILKLCGEHDLASTAISEVRDENP
ncbi:acyl-phosphate glycerol 3-phosphate acyltransferase [Dechloromonas denitrificans]|uniref:Acyl-phosphate glycerol 3-phosphate acyltransferase n=1 Tax=Dechloromonas denitrificans TaxID=281362 RepID=A0A133XP37_9RHOO|nr:AMP-binding protein [Dechloromonas denitrificans]KXB32703.1 acyl-phosphate glycerol 3-phosphate acyltransferase [Dechloromonas denitrificans]